MGLKDFRSNSSKNNSRSSQSRSRVNREYGMVPIDRESEDPYELQILIDKLERKGFNIDNLLVKPSKLDFSGSQNEKQNLTRYVAQYFDGEGNLRIRAHSDSTIEAFVKANQHFKPRVAGLVDSEGSVYSSAGSADNKIGYRFRNVCSVSQYFDHLPPLFRYHIILYEFCDLVGADYRYSIDKRGNSVSHEWRTSSLHDVEAILREILQYLVIKNEQAYIFLNEIYPLMKDGKHNTKKGLLKVMRSADKMAEFRDSNTGDATRKYNYEHFAKELGWEDEVDGI